jgi:hypothetical protein
MIHEPITFGKFIEAYIKAHYFRPDGEDRNWEEYGDTDDNRRLIALAKESPIMVKSFSFAYFRGLSNFPLLDLKTTVTFDLPNVGGTDYSRVTRFLDLSHGECPPLMQSPEHGPHLSFIITERY